MNHFFIQFLTYNDEANRRFIDTIQLERPHTERLNQILSHILNAHRIWNMRIDNISPTSGVWDVHPVEQWVNLNQENFTQSLKIVESMPLDLLIDYKDMKGHPHQDTVQNILTHVVNHSSYHRGQLAILLGQQEKKPPVTDFIAYVRERG